MIPALGNAFTSVVSYVPGTSAWHKQELMQKLTAYVEEDYAGAIEKLLEKKEDVDLIVAALKESAYSPLHQAATQGKRRALKAMLDKLPLGVWNIHAQDSGCTPLMLAAEKGNDEFVRQLSYKLSDYMVACERRLSPSMRDKNLDDLKREFDCELEQEPVNRSVWRKIVNARDHNDNTPLLLAVKNNHYLCCRALLCRQADVEAQNNQGESPRSLVQELPKDSEIYQLFFEPSQPAKSMLSICTIS